MGPEDPRQEGCQERGLPGSSYASLWENTLARLKMGMYMATTMKPMMPPSTAIMTGSMRLVRPATALSTSSS